MSSEDALGASPRLNNQSDRNLSCLVVCAYVVRIASGIKRDRIVVTSYQSVSPEASAPIRVSYISVRAQTDKCGRWPEDILETSENKHYADYGCSSQNNLAAQLANPADLLGPRKSTDIDAENRGAVIDVYRGRGISDEFLGNSEVTY